MITGRIDKDIEVKEINETFKVGTFTLVSEESSKRKDGSQYTKKNYIECKAFNNQADECRALLSPSDIILVEGSLRYESWIDKQGNKKSKVVIVVGKTMVIGKYEEVRASTYKNTPKIDEQKGFDFVDDLPF